MAPVRATSGEAVYLLAANRFHDGRWEDRQLVTSVAVYPDVDLGSSVLGTKLTIRTGPQYSFAIGTRSAERDDSIRFLATQKNVNGWLYVRGGICDYQLKQCYWYENWTFGVSRINRESQRMDVFNPNVSAFSFFGMDPRWQASFLTRYGNSTTAINLTRANLGYVNGAPFSIPVDIATNNAVCSDQRGYWGDYDAFLPIQVETDRIRFMRFMTDSSSGCVNRSLFIGERQHLKAVDYWY
jgi:hypothetical protein